MFGLHGMTSPGQDDSLNTTGGLMYYQYDGMNSVAGLTDRHGDNIEQYRYDAFGNILTGITAPYNTIGYTGQEYDDKAGLIYMNARWYNSNIGRFMQQDTYMGDMLNPQSQNLYSYVMNNPINMWDPTGNVPSWVGQDTYYELMPDNRHVDFVYYLNSHDSYSTGWQLINRTETAKEISEYYRSKTVDEWSYRYLDFQYKTVVNEETGETEYEYTGGTARDVTFRETDYYYKTLVITAVEQASKNQDVIKQLIQNRLGDPPTSEDPPAFSISTRDGEVLDGEDVILNKTDTKPSEKDSIVTSAIQLELNKVLGIDLDVDGWYGKCTAGAVTEIQKEYGLPQNGVLDKRTFLALEFGYDNYSYISKQEKLFNLENDSNTSSDNISNNSVDEGSQNTTEGSKADYWRNKIVEEANYWLGKIPYKLRSPYDYMTDILDKNSPPSSMDCSDFTSALYVTVLGIRFKDYTGSQFKIGTSVDTTKANSGDYSDLKPGDLIIFDWTSTNNTPDHVAVYVGGAVAPDGSIYPEGTFIHESHTYNSVRKASLDENWGDEYGIVSSNIISIRRIIQDNGTYINNPSDGELPLN